MSKFGQLQVYLSCVHTLHIPWHTTWRYVLMTGWMDVTQMDVAPWIITQLKQRRTCYIRENFMVLHHCFMPRCIILFAIDKNVAFIVTWTWIIWYMFHLLQVNVLQVNDGFSAILGQLENKSVPWHRRSTKFASAASSLQATSGSMAFSGQQGCWYIKK